MATAQIVVPPAILEKFSALVSLIQGSESMTDEERQYWVNILPSMTPEQRTTLEGILTNEKEKLAAIDAKYNADVSKIQEKISVAEIEQQRRTKQSSLRTSEQQASKEEEQREAELLKNIQNS